MDSPIKLTLQSFSVKVVIKKDDIDTFTLKAIAA